MNNFQKLKNSIKEGNFRHRIFTLVLIILGYSNYHISGLEMRNKVFRYLKKKYGKKIEKLVTLYNPNKDVGDSKNNIWICWFQGVDNAPDLVKCCISSVYKYMPDKNIHIITKDNMFHYVSFPPHIIEKWEKGIISNTFMSDLLRMQLLISYGGLWLDSTILLTGRIPEYVYKKSIFMYSIVPSTDINRLFNNYFIYADKGNEFLITLRDILYLYWEKENKNRDYFQWHLFATLCAPYYTEILKDMPFIPDTIPHMLSLIIFNQYDESYWNELTKITAIHKLSNKFNVPENLEGTYYQKIFDESLNLNEKSTEIY